MDEKFLLFLKKNGIDKDDVVSQLYLAILEQGEKIVEIKNEIEKMRSSDYVAETLKDVIKNDLVIGINNASVVIDYNKLAEAIQKVESAKHNIQKKPWWKKWFDSAK